MCRIRLRDLQAVKQRTAKYSHAPENQDTVHYFSIAELTHISPRVRCQDLVVTGWIALRTEVVEQDSQGLFSSEAPLHGFTARAPEAEGGSEPCVVRWGLSGHSIGTALLGSLHGTERMCCNSGTRPSTYTLLVLE